MNEVPISAIAPRSPWHEGERRMQQQLGVADRMEVFGSKVIRDFMPDQHRDFYAQLPFLLVAAVDDDGAPWASIFAGKPGFAHSPDPRQLRIDAALAAGDPAAEGTRKGAAIGLLGIELTTRRRNRINGRIADGDSVGISVSVDHAFGNCPQYIQTREASMVRDPQLASSGLRLEGNGLDTDAVAMIRAADTFFVASYVDIGGVAAGRAVDVSHRGGKPGFVRIDGDVLTIPDFAGNLHFNTLGNLLINPRAGLLFIDFHSGDVLQLTGTTELVMSGEEIAAFQGAERLWKLHVTRRVLRRDALPLRFGVAGFSPNSMMTGSWEEAGARLRAKSLADQWRPFRVARIVDESTGIRSFDLVPADGEGLPLHVAGQHLPIRVRVPGEAQPSFRNYTLSTAPSDGRFRISVKRAGRVSEYLHKQLSVGDVIDARAPAGQFGVDAQERRPLVLLAAGIGITPLLAQLRHVVYEGLRIRRVRPTYLFYAARSKSERAFDRELQQLIALGNQRVILVSVLSSPGPDDVEGRDYNVAGRIDVELLKGMLPLNDYDFHLCGPMAFTQSLYDGLRALRIADDRIHAESFGPSALVRKGDAPAAVRPALAAVATQSVRVVFERSGKEARWQPGAGSLLELAESRGLNPEFGCRHGKCGTCRTRISNGAATYATAPEAEHNAESALICCAVPAAADPDQALVLDL